MNVSETLNERGTRYGRFQHNAELTQRLKDVCREAEGWERLPPIAKEALDLVFMKISRAINGDPMYLDSWHDPQGYFLLVENWIKDVEEAMRKSSPFEPPRD